MRIDELDGHALRSLEKITTGVRADQFDAATPCTEWTVKDLLAHIVAVNRKHTGIALGDPWKPGVAVVNLGNDPARAYHDMINPLLRGMEKAGRPPTGA